MKKFYSFKSNPSRCIKIIIYFLMLPFYAFPQSINWTLYSPASKGFSLCWNSSLTKMYLGNNDGVWKSLDAGMTWVNIYPGPAYVSIVLMINDTLYANFTSCIAHGIRYTANDGLTWTTISYVTPGYEIAANTTTLYCASWDYTYYTHNHGVTWQVYNTPSASGASLSIAVDGNQVCIGGDYSKLFLSTDNGANWTTSSLPGNQKSIWSVYVSKQKIFAGTTSGLYRSDDFGSTWVAAGLSGKNITSIRFFGKYGFVGTINTGSSVYFSSDSGNTWVKSVTNLPQDEVHDFISVGNQVLACTKYNGTWATPLTLTDIGEMNPILPEFIIYPNPVENKVLYIIFNDKPNFKHARIKIYNSLGKLIVEKEIDDLISLKKIDLSAYKAGIYFIAMEDGKNSISKKIMLN